MAISRGVGDGVLCSQCKAELKDNETVCHVCGHRKPNMEDVDLIINSLIEEDIMGASEDIEIDDKDLRKKRRFRKDKKAKTEGKMIQGIRYMIFVSIILFIIALFTDWFTLSGTTMDYGFVNNSNTQKYIQNVGEESYIDFSGYDLFNYSRSAIDEHKMIKKSDGDISISGRSVMHMYIMLAMAVLMLTSLIACSVAFLHKAYVGIAIIRNLAIVNLIIIGSNYIFLNITYLSAIAIRAKSVINQQKVFGTLHLTFNGISHDQYFYTYKVTENAGFYGSIVALGIWLTLSIILYEMKNSEKVRAIENGEIDEDA
ncbi:conserved membrane protein of unknown function [Petrocella atlantisensis]|uniref:Uncharacterized protein n=1 Tax=Petrocella atlantisensis TaxID=2173034 RepID=A0A3P7PTK6_9FIRM|nr:hypothetical protein [Petrocella atlantisensis]VDN46571.1 conserved membrane protein of unknown function [Petrocella atlantisensis]